METVRGVLLVFGFILWNLLFTFDWTSDHFYITNLILLAIILIIRGIYLKITFVGSDMFREKKSDLIKEISKSPTNQFGYERRAGIHFKLKNYNLAIKDYSQAIKLGSNSFYTFYERGLSYKNSKKYLKAIEDFERAINCNKNIEKGYFEKGLLLIKLKKYDEGITELNNGVQISIKNDRALKFEIETHHSINQDLYRKIIRGLKSYKVKEDINKYFLLGWFHMHRQGTYYEKKAISYFRNVINLDPKYNNVLVYRGRVYKKLNRNFSALRDFNEAIKLNPNNYDVYYFKSFVSKTATEDLGKAIEIMPDLYFTYERRGYLYEQQAFNSEISVISKGVKYQIANYNKAIKDYSKCITLLIESKSRVVEKLQKLYFDRGVCKSKVGDFFGSVLDFNLAKPYVGSYSWTEPLSYYRALAKEKIGDFYGALEDYQNTSEFYYTLSKPQIAFCEENIKEENLKRNNLRIKKYKIDWDNINPQFKYFDESEYLFFAYESYYAVNSETTSKEIRNNRNIISEFRNGINIDLYSSIISQSILKNKIISSLIKNSEVLFSIIPPISKKYNLPDHYYKFVDKICNTLGFNNGTKLISFKGQSLLQNKRTITLNEFSNNLVIDLDYINDATIILFAPILHSSKINFITVRNKLLEKGAKKVIGIFLVKEMNEIDISEVIHLIDGDAPYKFESKIFHKCIRIQGNFDEQEIYEKSEFYDDEDNFNQVYLGQMLEKKTIFINNTRFESLKSYEKIRIQKIIKETHTFLKNKKELTSNEINSLKLIKYYISEFSNQNDS